MTQAVVCRACGARIKAGRERCLRCGGKLEGSPGAFEPRQPRSLYKGHGLVFIAGIVLSLCVLLVVASTEYLKARPSNPPPIPASTPGPQTATVMPSPEPETRHDDVRFLDHRLAGTDAYAHGDFASAAERYRKAIDGNPTDADALNNLGQVLVRMGRSAEAIPYFERALGVYPRVWAYRFNLARAKGQIGDWAQAVAQYRAARELFRDDYVTQFNLAHALQQLGNHEEAISEYRKAIMLAPGEPSFHLAIAASFENLNRSNEAVEAYRQYLEMVPNPPEAQQVRDRIQALANPSSNSSPTPAGATAESMPSAPSGIQ